MKTNLLFILILAFVINSNHLKAQTVIEMMNPGDANLVLLEVTDITKADVVIYLTEDKTEVEEWDYMWKFKKWGFSNFSVYVTKNSSDSLLVDAEMGVTYQPQGKIYFTTNKEERGIKTPGFHLEGIFMRTKTNNTEEGKKSKEKAKENSEQKFGNE